MSKDKWMTIFCRVSITNILKFDRIAFLIKNKKILKLKSVDDADIC